jgi:alcohol dehydrogenase class IV
MLIGAHLAGRAIDQAQTTACHALSYALTSQFGLSHGRAVALMLAPVWRFNAAVTDATSCDPRGARRTIQMMSTIANLIDASTIENAGNLIEERLKQLGTPMTFEETDIHAHAAIDAIVRSTPTA